MEPPDISLTSPTLLRRWCSWQLHGPFLSHPPVQEPEWPGLPAGSPSSLGVRTSPLAFLTLQPQLCLLRSFPVFSKQSVLNLSPSAQSLFLCFIFILVTPKLDLLGRAQNSQPCGYVEASIPHTGTLAWQCLKASKDSPSPPRHQCLALLYLLKKTSDFASSPFCIRSLATSAFLLRNGPSAPSGPPTYPSCLSLLPIAPELFTGPRALTAQTAKATGWGTPLHFLAIIQDQ